MSADSARAVGPISSRTPGLAGNEFEQVARLALELTTECFERREADGARLVGLEDREIGERDSDAFGEFGQADLAIRHDAIQIELDGHGGAQTVRSLSRWSARP